MGVYLGCSDVAIFLDIWRSYIRLLGLDKKKTKHVSFSNIVPSKDGSEGKEPDLPECLISFYARYPASYESTWCFCDSEFDTDDINSLNLEKVSDELEILLDSAKLYAPAFALTFNKVNSLWPQTSMNMNKI
ncbi:MAG: hypothetical protein ACN4GM_06805 [Gammaproteobacteria bacterium]